MILLDVDKFKDYNDRYGHYAGDKAIKKLADLIKGTFRSSDILGRFGGDEFIMLLKDFSDTAKIREKIQPILHFESDGHQLTTSVGIARYPQDGVTFEVLFQKADRALYHAKAKKGTVSFFSND